MNTARPVTMEPRGRMRVPVQLFLQSDLVPGDVTLRELGALATTAHAHGHIAALPDVHSKARNLAPTGTVLASRDHLVPLAVDKGINCGMRMLRTNIPANACTDEVLDALFSDLQRRVPIRATQRALDKKQVREALVGGAAWAVQHFGLSDEERGYIEQRGNLFEGDTCIADDDPAEIVDSLPKSALKKARRGFGTLGAGNHFIEAQEIVEVMDREKARALGLQQGHVVFMMHTGSGAVSGQVMRYYSPHARPNSWSKSAELAWDKLRFHGARGTREPLALWRALFGRQSFYGVRAESDFGRRFVRALYAASNFGFVNRMAITEALRASVRDTFADDGIVVPLLYDCSHVTIQRERHDGVDLWIHRHGANVALPPSKCANHPVFRHTGQPIPVPGSMGSDSFICVGVEGNSATFHSANHGAGRIVDKPEASRRWSEADVERDMQQRRVRLYRGGTMNIAEQAPGSFKDIADVIASMQAMHIASPVVRTHPLATMKG